MARLYSNENFPLPVVEELRNLGHDVLTTHEAGQAGRAVSDDSLLDFAHSEGRAVLTFNRKHFIRLHGQGKAHSGIIACTYDPNFDDLAQPIHKVIEGQSELVGQLLRVNRPLA
jgi:hypothetical protein